MIAAATAVVLAGLAWLWYPEKPEPQRPRVPVSEPEYRLLQDALDIVEARAAGDQGFTFVPQNRPPQLLRIGAGSGSPVIDTYRFGTRKLQTMVQFKPAPDDLCATIKRGDLSGMCVRGGPTGVSDPAFAHVTVYISGNVQGAPSTDDPDTVEAQKFWSRARFVPVAEAAWFSELVSRAKKASA